MKLGRVQQIGTPKELYFEPENIFVAGFIGDPAMNFIKGKVVNDTFIADNNEFSFEFIELLKNKLSNYDNKQIVIGFRPENISLEKEDENSVALVGNIELTEMLGDTMNIYVSLKESKIIIRTIPKNEYKIGDRIEFFVNQKCVHLFDSETENRIK